MRERISDIRRRMRYVGTERIAEIGCIVVVNALFFHRDAWVPQPMDWPVRVPQILTAIFPEILAALS
jgi:hypothetical protein